MIRSFRHRGLQRFFQTGSKAGIDPRHAERLARILDRLDAAAEWTISTTTDKEGPMKSRRPTHPGKILRLDYLEPLELTITGLAETLGVSRKTVSKIVNERGAVTADMALRLSRAFDTTPELWLNLQQRWDLWQAANRSSDWKDVPHIAA